MYKEDVLIVNGVVVSSDLLSFAHSPVYEVIRIHNGYPAFLLEHLERLKQSAKLADIPDTVDYKRIASAVKSIIHAASIEENNIRIELGISTENGQVGYKIYPVPSIYPDRSVYETGVDVETMIYDRENPTAKIKREYYSAYMAREVLTRKVFELLLVSRKGLITEGTKSNMFFVKNKEIVTPKSDYVLSGVTRGVVIEQAKLLKDVYIGERDIHFSELSSFDAVFITGTSPGVLPVRRIDDTGYNSANNKLVQQLRKMYENVM